MKRILATGSIAAFAMLGFAGTANAAPSDSAAFGQLHKTINTEGVFVGETEFTNVGDLVKVYGGQGKKGFK